MEAGEPNLDQLRRRAADQPIEHVGLELRALMHRETAEARGVS
jgi:hypothetical protein